MASGSVRGFAVGALGLIALQTLTQDKAAGQVAGLWGVLSGLVSRLMDPNVAALPDHSSKSSSGSAGGVGGDGTATGAGVLDPKLANLPNAAAIVAAQQAAAGGAAAVLTGPAITQLNNDPSSWLSQLRTNLAPLGPGYQYPKAPPATAVR